MNWKNNRIVKGIKNLPAIREPKRSEADKLRLSHLWALQPRVKDIGLNIGTILYKIFITFQMLIQNQKQ